ncbi:MAG: protein-L-isoaspartate(D-aspartate) O-methyltransferase [Gammaproteobacteria bacterium]|jgi:protein-L-isoaspartate(D-aspartate) O-methyltransferase
MSDDIARMLRDIRREVELTRSWIGKEELDPRVLAAMAKVQRHEFVPQEFDYLAYSDGPLGIGHGQTISQPYIVALMTDLLRPQAGDVVLEVGTGSGYQAAVLSLLVKQVYSVEIVAPLAQESTARLRRLGYDNVSVRCGDGYLGWEEHAPFDAVIVTAAALALPPPLLEQLKCGGRMVIPVGMPYGRQVLSVIDKDEQGSIATTEVLPVAFVPLTGSHGKV